MAPTVERLDSGDFAATIAFLNRVFGAHRPHDFARMLPARYRPTSEHMRHQLAVRDGGRIVALLGLFPLEWRFGSRRLTLAGIGGVSVAPEHRGRGLMRALFEHALGLARAEACDLVWLAGDRRRYLHFGFERAGTEVELRVSPRELEGLSREPAIRLVPFAEANPDAATLAPLVAGNDLRCARPHDDFAAFLASWHHEPLAALSAAGQVVGYLAAHPESGLVHELAGRDREHRRAIAANWVRRRALATDFVTASPFDPVAVDLGPLAERIQLSESGNWLLLAWSRVLDAILGGVAELGARALVPGEVVLAVAGTPERLRLWSDGARAGCSSTTATPALELPAPTLLRLLFGPLPPSAVATLPRAAQVLAAWCPLPLGLPRQDQV